MAKTTDNNAMHAKSGLRVVLEWKIYRPDSVIAVVIWLNRCDLESSTFLLFSQLLRSDCFGLINTLAILP